MNTPSKADPVQKSGKSASGVRLARSSHGASDRWASALLLLAAGLTGSVASGLHAATLYWDGASAGWDAVANWSTASAATTPDPTVVPAGGDGVIFNILSVNGAETVSLNAAQAVSSLTIANAGTTDLQGGGTNQTLTLGAGGIEGQGILPLNILRRSSMGANSRAFAASQASA